MPTLPEEEVRPEHQEATQSAKPNVLAAGTGMNTTPAIVLPEVTGSSDKESDRATHLRCPSPIQRKSSRNSRASLSSASSLTTVDGDGHVYDLVNDQLPDVELSDEDRKKNTELLEEAKKISERFHSRRSRRSRTSVSDSPPEPDMAAVRTMAVPSLQAGEEEAPSPIRDKEMKENKLMRSQNLSAQRLPDLSESNEQERGPSPVPCPATNGTDGSCDATPSIPDCLLRKLKVQRTLPAGLPPLTEKEVENTFVQLSLAFKNDSYTLEARLGLAERERNLAEDNTERELENFKSELKSSASLWANSEQREAQERLLETVAVLQRLAIRLSGRAEMVGAVRQEKRMSKATEVMMQYVENLKRMYEKDHAELTEFKKLANQNSNRNYSPYGDSSDDGVPRTARSMSLTLGKSVPRRRVSVAVLPKFVNFPGQPGSASAVPTVAAVVGHPLICKTDMESNNNTEANTASSTSNSSSSETITSTTSAVPSSSSRTSPMLAPVMEMKQNDDKEVAQTAAGTVRPLSLDLTSLETKAKIEEEAFNKGYQEGLKAQLSQDQKELRHETGKAEGASEGPPADTSLTEGKKASKLEEVTELIVRLCPKPARHRSVIWVVATFVLLLAVLSSIFASLRSPCDQATGSPSTKGSCLSSGHSSTWPFWRLWHRNRAQA
ncbi:inositol 1,4,5-triphosphate receptor associated 1 isoform X4 [Mobula hypostoma]|uniref:inositol 1,4,5-triphosphate receptor associated 1 isoform X4 n=1 Tax=Mobula hypostoma TaxID=723540 RepID=UPI002FC33F08